MWLNRRLCSRTLLIFFCNEEGSFDFESRDSSLISLGTFHYCFWIGENLRVLDFQKRLEHDCVTACDNPINLDY